MSYLFGNGFRVKSFYHATNVVKDMSPVAEFHKRVFGTETITIPYGMNRWASFTWLGDVPVETTSPNVSYATPKRMFLQLAGNHWAPSVFWVDDLADGLHRFASAGYRFTNLLNGRPVEGVPNETPEHAQHVYANPFQTGVEWGLYQMDRESPITELILANTDPFEHAGSYLPHPAREGFVNVERHAQHCVVTDDAEKTLTFLVEGLGGEVFAHRQSRVLGTNSTFVSLGTRPFTVEVAEPFADGGARRDLQHNGAIYHRLDLHVGDLDAAIRHLESVGVGFEAQGDSFVTLDPSDCCGLRYGLFAKLADNDPRLG